MSAPHAPEDVAATFCATLVDEWIHLGVRHAVVAPGSRSTPLALALADRADRADLQLHVFHDERAAAFAALGIGLLGVPAVLLCTSGTAAAHFHAAVVEAHQSAVPVLVCTADRPPELRDVGAPQTIDQTKLYGSAVRWFHDPGIATIAARHTWRSLAAHCFDLATGHWPGPVHLNLPFREPLLGTPLAPPERTPASSGSLTTTSTLANDSIATIASLLHGERGVIVAGRGCGSPSAIRAFAAAKGWPVLADARSGVRHLSDVAVTAADHLVRSPEFAAEHRPTVVLRLGEPPASKVVNQWLAASGATQIAVSAVPAWIDPDAVVARRMVVDPDTLSAALSSMPHQVDPVWLASWLDAESHAQRVITDSLSDGDLSEPLVARAIAPALPPGAQLVVSSSMPIRDIEWFGVIPESISVHSNRGANGIDGVIATSIGVTLVTGAPTALLIGDVAFLHDGSALVGLAARDIDLRIVLIDNDGGGIFNFLPQASALPSDRFEQLFGTPHHVDLVALAGAHGIATRTVKDLDDFVGAMAERGPSVTRIVTDRADNVAVHRRLDEPG